MSFPYIPRSPCKWLMRSGMARVCSRTISRPGSPWDCLQAAHTRAALLIVTSTFSRMGAAAAEREGSRATGREVAALPVWKTVRLGGYADVNALREALDSSECGTGRKAPLLTRIANAADISCRLGESAAEIIGRPAFRLSRERREVAVVLVSVAQLGFAADAALADIYARAAAYGLALCPAELAPYLRLQYRDQPLGEFLRVAMAPLETYAGEPTDLTVANGGSGLLLVGGDARGKLIVPVATRFVFMRP